MNEILKQRLVGALILVALGVVFWPIIFVQPERDNLPEISDIPPAPGVPATAIAPPTDEGLRAAPRVELEDEDPVVVQDPAPDEAPEQIEADNQPAVVQAPPPREKSREPRVAAPEDLAMDEDGIPVAWTLQVATLSSAEKAESLRKQLLDMEHKAYIARIQRNGKTLYRVSIGPQFERVQLERLKGGIDAKFGVKSLVARYVP